MWSRRQGRCCLARWGSGGHRNIVIAIIFVCVRTRSLRHCHIVVIFIRVIAVYLAQVAGSFLIRHSWRSHAKGIHDRVVIYASFGVSRESVLAEEVSFREHDVFWRLVAIFFISESVN